MITKRITNIIWKSRTEPDIKLLTSAPGLFAGDEPAPHCRAITWSRHKKAVVFNEAYLVKKYRYRSWLDRIRFRFVLPPANREIISAVRVAETGIPTVVPEAVGTEYRLGLPVASYVVIRMLVGARDLEAVLLTNPPRREVQQQLTSLADLTRSIHEAGIYQYDFNPSNFLLDADNRLLFIDMAKVSFHPRLDAGLRTENLSRLLRAAHKLQVTPTDSLRFYKAYRRLTGKVQESDRLAIRGVVRRFRRLLALREQKMLADCLRTGRRFYEVTTPLGRAHLAVKEYGKPRQTPEQVAELIHQLQQNGVNTVAFPGGSRLQVKAIERFDPAVAAWQRTNVQYIHNSRRVWPAGLIVLPDCCYLLHEEETHRESV